MTWCILSAGSRASNWLSQIVSRPCNLLMPQALGVAEQGSGTPSAILESSLVLWSISVSTIASSNDILLTSHRLFPNFCGCLFPFLERNTSWQYVLSCHNCNILGWVSFPQDLLTLWVLLAYPPWTFAFDPTSRHCADFGVCDFALRLS